MSQYIDMIRYCVIFFNNVFAEIYVTAIEKNFSHTYIPSHCYVHIFEKMQPLQYNTAKYVTNIHMYITYICLN
jgi:hypothetical protein